MSFNKYDDVDPTPAEKAVMDLLRGTPPDVPVFDVAAAVVEEVDPHLTAAAYEKAIESLGALAGMNEGALSADWVDGVKTAAKILGEDLDKLRLHHGLVPCAHENRILGYCNDCEQTVGMAVST